MVRKLFRKLTPDQKNRGVIFSSSLSADKNEGKIIHEVKGDEEDKYKHMARLRDDKFFRGADCPYKYNIIRKE